ncbi:MAG: zinc-binding dehydrogenase [Planctomycetaceae bacterium]|nr:zinc-binding dehydrogenase [Planctomycetaceae bacterium]
MPTMPAVVQYEMKKGAVELRELPVPEPGPGEVLLRVKGVGVCGSDVHQYHNTQSWTVGVPVVLGHEFCGEIAAVGKGVKGWTEGDRVASETAAEIDLDCPLTRQGMYNLDPSRQAFGCNRDGAMAAFVKVPTRTLHRVPKNVPFEVAAMTEPCCVAYQCTVVNSRIRPGDLVVVLGPGPIGLLSATLARLSGAGRVIIVGMTRDKARMEVGLRAGATHAADLQTEDVGRLIAELGDGLGADVVIDSTGASASLKSALDWVRPAGHITKVGWGPQPMNFSLDPLVKKAVTLQGSFSHTWAVWERVLEMLGTGQLDPRPYLSSVAPLEKWQPSFDGMHRGDLIKAVLTP